MTVHTELLNLQLFICVIVKAALMTGLGPAVVIAAVCERYPKNMVSVAAWCRKCIRFTQHRVDDGNRGPCLDCIDELNKRPKPAKPEPDRQQELFA